VASMPTRSVDLATLRVSPARFFLLPAALATGPPCDQMCSVPPRATLP
jgi:hypothetical protein